MRIKYYSRSVFRLQGRELKKQPQELPKRDQGRQGDAEQGQRQRQRHGTCRNGTCRHGTCRRDDGTWQLRPDGHVVKSSINSVPRNLRMDVPPNSSLAQTKKSFFRKEAGWRDGVCCTENQWNCVRQANVEKREDKTIVSPLFCLESKLKVCESRDSLLRKLRTYCIVFDVVILCLKDISVSSLWNMRTPLNKKRENRNCPGNNYKNWKCRKQNRTEKTSIQNRTARKKNRKKTSMGK